MTLKTLDELLEEINSFNWIKQSINIPYKNDISIERIEYVEERNFLTCSTGNFYNKDTNENLGKKVRRRIYFVENSKVLDKPKLIPNIEWRAE